MEVLPIVVHAEYGGDFRVVFNDGVAGTVDFSEWLTGPVFQPLKDRRYFARFFVEGGTVTWPNGASRPRPCTSEPRRVQPPKLTACSRRRARGLVSGRLRRRSPAARCQDVAIG